MATKNETARAAIETAQAKAAKVSTAYQHSTKINNAQRTRIAWRAVLALVPIMKDQSDNCCKLARKAYAEAGDGIARKTAQCHAGMARAIAKGNYDAPVIGKTNDEAMALPSLFKVFEGFTASGDVAKVKTVPTPNAGDKPPAVNGPQTGGAAGDAKGTPAAYVTDSPELRQAMAALTIAFRSDTPPTSPAWQKLRRQWSAVAASVTDKEPSH